MIRPKVSPIVLLVFTTAISAVAACFVLAEQRPDSLDTSAIEKLTGAPGKLDQKEGVFKVSVPRKDLSVVIAGVRMTPPMGLPSWAAFQRSGKDDMVMATWC